VPVLVASHPALLELIRGSTASIINMGARARVGEASMIAAVLLGVPSLMMFDRAVGDDRPDRGDHAVAIVP
jgi:hypothetical protein